jgi:hypothetical protein
LKVICEECPINGKCDKESTSPCGSCEYETEDQDQEPCWSCEDEFNCNFWPKEAK